MSGVLLIIIFIVFVFFILLSRKTKCPIIRGGESNYRYTRYPKFCCDDDPIPLTLDQYNNLIEGKNLDDDTKFLYKVLHDSNIRVVVEFDKSDFKGDIIYKKTLKNISEKHGRNIYYQIAVMNDYSVHDYPKKDKYDINIYFIPTSTRSKMYIKNYYNTVVASKLFLNNNSIEFLKYQDLDRFNSFQMKDSRIMFNTYLNFLNTNVDLYDQEKILLIHGIISYFLGLRFAKDIDVDIDDDMNLYNKIEQNITNDVVNYGSNDSFTQFEVKKYLEEFNLKDIKELFYNPKKYMYFLGVKCYSLDLHITSRYIRNRPNAIAEIIALNYKTSLKYRLPKIPDKNHIVSYEGWKDIISTKHKKYLDNKLNTEENIIDKNKFLSTIKFYLYKKYNIVLSIEEIKKYYI